MALTLDKNLVQFGPSIYYTDKYRDVVEDHLGFMKDRGLYELMYLNQNHDALLYQYEGDLYGLFTRLLIPRTDHFATMRINGWHSPFIVQPDLRLIIVPDSGFLAKLSQVVQQKTG